MGLFRVFLLESYKWIGLGWMGWDWDLCVGLLYEHRFAVLITKKLNFSKDRKIRSVKHYAAVK